MASSRFRPSYRSFRRWSRLRTGLLLLLVVVLGTTSAGSPLDLAGSHPQSPRHAAPGQRWGAATDEGRVPLSVNRTLPKTEQAKYPPKPLTLRANEAHTEVAPPAAYRGYDPKTSVELPAERGTNQRVYANTDGTRTTELSPDPVNYRKPDGTLAPIDTRLVAAPDGWRVAADAGGYRAPARSRSGLGTVDLDGDHSLSFALAGAADVAGQVDGSTVTYSGVLPQTDVRLTALAGGGVKETLVLHGPGAPKAFDFPLDLRGLTARAEGGEIALFDASGARRATVPAGDLRDAADARSGGVAYRLDQGGVLHVTLDQGWLADPARSYPVEVDPSVDVPVTGIAATSGMYVRDGGPSVLGGSSLVVGRRDGNRNATYLKFPGVLDALRNHTIYGAQLLLVNQDSGSCTPRPVSVAPVTDTWTAGTGFTYANRPKTGAVLGSASFAHGASPSCPATGETINLGSAGRALVQGWANGAANNGLAVLASETDGSAWKEFTGTATANPPKLYVTHSAYNATYEIPNPVPDPPVQQNQAGKVKVTVTNLGAEDWQPGAYYLAYRAYNASTGAAVTQQRAANLPAAVARGARVTFDATIQPLPPGTYFLDFTMVRTGGVVFTDQLVPPARIALSVYDIPPVVEELFPPNGYQSPTLTPQLWARGVDADAPAGSTLSYKFQFCELDAANKPVNCLDSGYQKSPAWSVPAGKMVWGKNYQWHATVKDGSTEVPSPDFTLLAQVPQPDLTSHIAAAPHNSQDKEFDPQAGNLTTSALDAPVVTVGPGLNLVRSYNSLDPRRDEMFGAGWITRYDMKLQNEDDGSGNVLLTYPDGQQVRYGRNPDGSYATPNGRTAKLSFASSQWTLLDQDTTTYTFSASGRLARITDSLGRSTVFTYDPNTGKLTSTTAYAGAVGGPGRTLRFTWSGSHVASVSTDPVDGNPLVWTYTYNGDLLTRVCAPGAVCTGYEYATGSQYRSVVLDAKPASYWRFGESSGTAAGSEIGINLGKDAGTAVGAGRVTPGALAGTDNAAASFSGTAYVELPKGTLKKSHDAAIELWFKAAPTGTGGPLLGYQDKPLGTAPGVGVPLLYVGTDGLLHGQFATGTIQPIASNRTVNDGQWHHAVLSAMGNSQTLYLDGVPMGSLNGSIIDEATLTYNQIGAASVAGSWPAWGTDTRRSFAGSIDEVALYPHPLGAAAVAAHNLFGRQASSQLSKVTLPSGKVASETAYDPKTGRVKEYTDDNGGTWRIGAPAVYGDETDLRRSVEVRDPANRPYLYEYDAVTSRMLRSGVPAGLETREEDQPNPPVEPVPDCPKPDPADPKFCTVLPDDAGGTVFVRHSLEGMAVRTFDYDDSGNQHVVTNEVGDQVTFDHDDRGNITARKTCRTTTTCFTAYYSFPPSPVNPYDPRASLATESRDGRSSGATDNRYRTLYTYNAGGQPLVQTNPDGGLIQHTYTSGGEPAIGGGVMPPGLPKTTTDPGGNKTSYAYNAYGDLVQLTAPSGLITNLGYDALGRKTSQTAVSDTFPAGVTTTYGYDALSHLVSTTEAPTTDAVTGDRHQQRRTDTYDPDGNVVRTELADVLGTDAPRVVTTDFDEHNNAVRVVDPEGAETSYRYDQFGNKAAVIDANGVETDYAYTARNAVGEVRLRNWRPGPGEPPSGDYLVQSRYSYDYAGRVFSSTDAMGHRLEYEYNSDDSVKRITLKDFHNPDGSKRDYVVEDDTYDGAGNVVRKATANGVQVTTTQYDASGRAVSTTDDPGGAARTTTYAYDASGNVTRTTAGGSPVGVPWPTQASVQTADFTYNATGNRLTESFTDGSTTKVTRHTYDQRGLLTSTTGPRGTVAGADPAAFTSTVQNDELGRPARMTSPPVAAESNGGAAQVVTPTVFAGFDAFGEQTSTKDELGNVSHRDYDHAGRPVRQTAPSYLPPGSTAPIVPVSTSRYDPVGNVVETTDARGAATRLGYDQQNRLVSKDEPASTNDERSVTHYTYTRTGQLLSTTGPTGVRTEATYDDLNRQVSSTEVERYPAAENYVTTHAYDDMGNLTSSTSPTGAQTTTTYDAVNEPLVTKDPSGVVTQFGYDSAGNQVRVTDGLGRTTRKDYDGFNRLVVDSDLSPGGQTLRSQSYGYDPADNIVSAKDALGALTQYEYNAADQLVKQVEPISPGHSITTTFGYDAAGNRTRYTDGRGDVTVSTVNSLGLPESVIEPSTSAYPGAPDRTWTVAYDAAANPTRVTAPGNVVRDRTYDAAGQLTKEVGSGAEAATMEREQSYDLAGQLTGVNAPGGRNAYSYDDRGDLLTSSGPSGNATFGYDGDGDLTSRTDAAGTARYTYVSGRLSTMADGATGTLQKLGYDASGDLSSVDYGAGRVRTFTHDDLGRLSSDVLKNQAGQQVASITYGYDKENRLTGKVTTGTAGAGSNSYAYDQAGRLTSWQEGGKTTTYAWDDAGNRTQAGATTSTYDERNRLTDDGGQRYTYTPRGTLASTSSSGLTESMSFDAFDRMIGNGKQNYAYDGLDRLASRNGSSFGYAGQSDDVVSDGVERYARGPAGELLAQTHGDAARLTLADRHGDIVGDFDPADNGLNSLSDSASFDPFGAVTATSGDRSRIGFQGDWTDPDTGQVDMGSRWYDPGTARFDSRDSENYTSGDSILANRYTYGAGDPLNYSDPDGHWPNWLSNAWNYTLSKAKAVVHTVVKAAAAVVNDAVQAVRHIASAVVSFARSVGSAFVSGVKTAFNWGKQAFQGAVNFTREAVQRSAAMVKAAAKATLKVTQIVVKAALKPLVVLTNVAAAAVKLTIEGAKLLAKQVADVAAKAADVVRRTVETAAHTVMQAAATVAQAASEFYNTHRSLVAGIAGFAAGLVTGGLCGAAIGWTGVGAVACGALAGVVGSVVHDVVEGGHSLGDIAVNALGQGLIGGLTGGLGSVVGAGLGAGVRAFFSGGGGRALSEGAQAALSEGGNILAGRVTGGALAKGAGSAAEAAEGGLESGVRSCNSFAATTPVLMADGSHKPISTLQVGDTVQATDPTTGKTAAEPVDDVIVGTGDKHLVEIAVISGGTTEKLVATEGHPFWVDSEHRWVDAEDLIPGYHLETADHRPATVAGIRMWNEESTVYNLTVDSLHTYYVLAGTTPVLAHNCGNVATHDSANIAENLDDNVYFHYTNEEGHAGIVSHDGSLRLGANSAGKVHVTQEMGSPADIDRNIFINNPHYEGKSDYMVAFRMPHGVKLNPGSQPNEMIVRGSLKIPPGNVIYHGENPF